MGRRYNRGGRITLVEPSLRKNIVNLRESGLQSTTEILGEDFSIALHSDHLRCFHIVHWDDSKKVRERKYISLHTLFYFLPCLDSNWPSQIYSTLALKWHSTVQSWQWNSGGRENTTFSRCFANSVPACASAGLLLVLMQVLVHVQVQGWPISKQNKTKQNKTI